MDQEEAERYASHQLQNSFLSTIDHLPCDVIRSLWLIQSCNIKIDKLKQELHNILRRYQTTGSIPHSEMDRIYDLKQNIRHLYNETIQEGKTLNNQMIIHKLHLENEITQLKSIKERRSGVAQMTSRPESEAQDLLRKQLKQHYKEHPLVSQVEAAVEHRKHSQKESHKSGGKSAAKSGIKLVLKIPKQDKVVKPKGRNVVKKNSSATQSRLKTISKRADPSLPKKEKKLIQQQAGPMPQVTEQVGMDEDEDEDNKRYCFCHQPSLGDMIACDNEASCPNGEWFHYKCVGLLNRVEALKYTTGKIPWYCSEGCRQVGEAEKAKSLEMKKRKRRRKW
ncbi:hypothetical protein KGF57_004323 [Candida theae]|uniref:Zinc finger PHD-type domain-containing protein n=1 Tax=Candida theae TaxID=1198502 RepID=A0AAD5BBX2_9ASCO|nr:uncharacterized protein KGF57_004323 [Candida theae]KAI5950454.1 hypothetical protein KGF57_004323 [Candida theae]